MLMYAIIQLLTHEWDSECDISDSWNCNLHVCLCQSEQRGQVGGLLSCAPCTRISIRPLSSLMTALFPTLLPDKKGGKNIIIIAVFVVVV